MESKYNMIHAILNDNVKRYRATGERYIRESELICGLSNYALNKEKNKVKGNFEDESLIKLLNNLTEEKIELEKEFVFYIGNNKDIKEIDFERVLEKIADVAASLTGVLVKVLKLYQEKENKK